MESIPKKKDWIKPREPFTFMLYLGIGGSGLFFLSLFLLFIKKEINSTDIAVDVPKVIWLSTFIIILSSVSLIIAANSQEKQSYGKFRFWLSTTFVLGLLFMFFQFQGWKFFYQQTQGSFSVQTGNAYLLLLSILHLLHTLGGVVGLSITIFKVFRNTSYVDAFVYSVNPPNQLNLKLISIYWHFLAILWIIIFLFLLYHAS